MKNTITSAAEVMLAAESELQGHTCDVDPERLRAYATALHDAGMLRPPHRRTTEEEERAWWHQYFTTATTMSPKRGRK